MLARSPAPASPALPSLDAATPHMLAVRVAPLAADDVSGWCAMLRRLPAVEALEARAFISDDCTAVFTAHVSSVARFHAQLRHLAERLQAHFAPSAAGALCLALRPAHSTSRAWERMAASSTAFSS